MEKSLKRSNRLSLQTSFYHRTPSSPTSNPSSEPRLSRVSSIELEPRQSCVSSIEQDILPEGLKIPKRKWADIILDYPHDPGTIPVPLTADTSSNKDRRIDEEILLEGTLRKAGEFKGKHDLRPRYFYLTRKFLSYHVSANGPAKGRLYFEDIVGLVSRDDFYFRPQPGLEWEIERAKEHELRRSDFVIVSSRIGFGRGRQYFIRAPNIDERKVWTASIRDVMEFHENSSVNGVSMLTVLRRRVRWIYFDDKCQIFVASLIMLNFAVNIIEAQLSSLDAENAINYLLDDVDTAFTALFTAELVVNMFGTLVSEYARDPWNWFDLIVVSVSLLSLGMTDMPGASTLRLLRCFRVFRLFKRIHSLRQLIVALGSSIPPMLNAFVLVCLVAAIYSILGATFFSRAAPDYFGDFFTALFFMFQTMTGDAWSDPARDLFVTTGNPAAVAIFFVSFQITLNLVLLNVVIAVLLDEFTKAGEKKSKKIENGPAAESGSLDRLCECLLPHLNRQALDFRLADLFRYIIFEARGPIAGVEAFTPNALSFELNYSELHDGLRRLGFLPPIEFTRQDWDRHVVGRGLLAERNDSEQAIGFRGFKVLIKHSIWKYTLRGLHQIAEADEEDLQWDADRIRLAFTSIKGILMEESCPSSIKDGEAAHMALIHQIMAGLDGAGKKLDSMERELASAASTASQREMPCEEVPAEIREIAPVLHPDLDPIFSKKQNQPKSATQTRHDSMSSAAVLRRRLAERLQQEDGPPPDDSDTPAVARSLNSLFQSEAMETTSSVREVDSSIMVSAEQLQPEQLQSDSVGKQIKTPFTALTVGKEDRVASLSKMPRRTMSVGLASGKKSLSFKAGGQPLEHACSSSNATPLHRSMIRDVESASPQCHEAPEAQPLAESASEPMLAKVETTVEERHGRPEEQQNNSETACTDNHSRHAFPDDLRPAVQLPSTLQSPCLDFGQSSAKIEPPPPPFKPTPAASLPVRAQSSGQAVAAATAPSTTSTPAPIASSFVPLTHAQGATSSTVVAPSLLSPMAMLMTPFGGIGFFPPDTVPLVNSSAPTHLPPNTAAAGAPVGAGAVANPATPNIFGALTAPWSQTGGGVGPGRPPGPEADVAGGLFSGFLDGLTALGGSLAGLGGGSPGTQAPALAAGLMTAASQQGPMLSKRLMGPS